MVQIELTYPARDPASPVAISSSSSTLPHAPACRVSWYSTYTARTPRRAQRAAANRPFRRVRSNRRIVLPGANALATEGYAASVVLGPRHWPHAHIEFELTVCPSPSHAGVGDRGAVVTGQDPECAHNLWAPRTPEDGISALEAHGPRPQDAQRTWWGGTV